MNPEIVIQHQKFCSGLPTLVFCTDSAQASAAWSLFSAMGVQAQALTATDPPEKRSEVIGQFLAGTLPVLIGARSLPDALEQRTAMRPAQAVVLLAPTSSPRVHASHFQHLEKGGIVLDFSDNVVRLGWPEIPDVRVYSRLLQLEPFEKA